jgi:4-amino-4-deoxy-L-arabinose transferase-like glycosyltransferase
MNLKKLNYNNTIIYFLLIIIAFAARFYLIDDRNSWHDEWHSIYVADPNISNEKTFLRYYGDKGDTFLTEFYPPLYLYILKLFFKLFGYIDDNGRYLSLIFGVLSVPLAMKLASMLKKGNIYISVGLLISFNLFLTWQSIEIRAHSIFIAFSLLNIILFYKILDNKNLILLFLYFISSLFLLSLWPITGAIFFGKTIYLIKDFVIKKDKNLIIFLLFILIFVSYIFTNSDYLIFNIGRDNHYTQLNSSFFYSYYFRSFFGSIYLGGIFLIIFAYLLIKNTKNLIFQNKREDLLILIILSSYFLTLLYSLLRAPIMSPKYVIFIIPLIVIWISIKIPYEKNKTFNFLLIFITIVYFTLNISNSPIKRPPTKFLLNQIQIKNIKLIVTPETDVFNNYLKTKKIVVNNEIKIIKKVNVLPDHLDQFWFVCLNNARFAIGDKGLLSNNLPPQEKCLKYKQDKAFLEILPPISNIQDYYIRRFKKNDHN